MAPAPAPVYIREISEYELLTPDDEVALAQRIEQGCEQGRELLINHNLRLVAKIARDYRIPTMPFMELVAEGNLGLLKAVERYDWRTGLRFSTVASTWINCAIKQAITDKSRVVRLPQSEVRRLRRDDPEVLSAGHESLDVLPAPRTAGSCRYTAKNWLPPKTKLVEQIPAPEREPTPEKLPRLALSRAMNVLTSREQEIIRARFALHGGEPESLRSVGNRLGLSFERIRQIQDEALEKLRQVANGLGLREYL